MRRPDYRFLYKLEYFYKPRIQRPLWSSHISVIRGEIILDEYIKSQLQGLEIEFLYSSGVHSNGVHFWLKVICPILDDIRQEFGLSKSIVDYHLSIGNIVDPSGHTTPQEFYDKTL